MTSMKDLYQSADWKTEKHVPVIESPDVIKKGDTVEIRVSVGKEIAHPNTTEHHISRITVYFLAQGEKFPVQLAVFEAGSHGASVQGPNTSTLYTLPSLTLSFKTGKSGTILAAGFRNIHGLWENSKTLTVD